LVNAKTVLQDNSVDGIILTEIKLNHYEGVEKLKIVRDVIFRLCRQPTSCSKTSLADFSCLTNLTGTVQ